MIRHIQIAIFVVAALIIFDSLRGVGMDSRTLDRHYGPMVATQLAQLRTKLQPLRTALLEHPLYRNLRSLAEIRAFQEHHVYAVWDFMSLLKALQRAVTCTDVPWRPSDDTLARRLVNEIVLAEESDDDGHGGYISHLELYIRSMRESKASTAAIETTLYRVRSELTLGLVLEPAPQSARTFCQATFGIIESRSLPAIAAAFTLGREDVIPDMFRQLVHDLHARGARLPALVDYLERHVAIDSERHGPMAERMLESTCGSSADAWEEARRGAESALRARVNFWTEIHAHVGELRALEARG